MDNHEAIEMLTAKAECIRRESSGIDVDCNHRNCDECDLCYKQGTMGDQIEALGVAISALQAQDSRRICNTCKHNPPSKKWPCEDCDMREPADRWEPKEVKNSTQEAKNLTQKGLDTISRRVAIDEIEERKNANGYRNVAVISELNRLEGYIMRLPSVQPEIIHCQDCIHAIEDALCGGYWCKGKAVTSDHYCGYAERRTDELGDS